MRKILLLILLILLIKIGYGQVNCYTASDWITHIAPCLNPGCALISVTVPPGTYVADATCYIYGSNQSEYFITVNTTEQQESERYTINPIEVAGATSTDKFTTTGKAVISLWAISLSTQTNVFNNMVLQVFQVQP